MEGSSSVVKNGSQILSSTMSKGKDTTVPVYMKYARTATQSWLDPSSKLRPSDLVKPSLDTNPEDYPLIVEFNNVLDHTSQFHSDVDLDQPIFQPAPRIIVFEDYKPYSTIQRKLFFRNKDTVARRIKLVKPDTSFFEISAPQTINGENLKQSKVAPGMEICYIVTFRPQEVRDYAWDLVCSTEREKFIVPLRAIGPRPLLTLPDEIDFGHCAIKATAEKKITVQNVGTSVAKFSLISHNDHFQCPPQDITIEAGASHPLVLSFIPQSTLLAEGDIEVLFNNDIRCFIAVHGSGRNVDVSLSTPSLTVEPSYISLFSQKTLKIRNASDAPITYRWKSFMTEEEEEAEKHRLLMEINRIEEEENALFLQRVEEGFYDDDTGADIMNDPMLDDELNEVESLGNKLPFAARADQAAIIRKYRNLRKALEMDRMLFVDDIFEISPIEGEVWAHSEMEVTVCFRPDTAAQYNCLAFLDVSGRHDRLQLQLTGQGIGPHASLSFEVLDIGDVFVYDINHYELTIKNKGDIPAQWTFMSSLTRFGNKFQFSPSEGYLLPNQSQVINIRFESDILGEFSEYFRFALQGNENMLVCQIKGHVLGPTFHFDCNSIDFGTVSYDYLHSVQVKLTNTSKVAMVYNLHVPQDGTYVKKEFNIEPSRGRLGPKETVDVTVEFIPTTVKVYDYSLAVDVLGVGDMLLNIPIRAECIISAIKVELPARELDFGDCFIRYPYERMLKLTNLSKIVHAKFEIAPQQKQTMSVATYEADPTIAVIEPGDSMLVKIKLTGKKLGAYKVPLTISVAGSQEPPLQSVLSFNTIGPKVIMGSTEMKWGNIECLKDYPKSITINNVGLIEASLKLFTKMARSCYRIEVREMILEAQQSVDVTVIANLDDSVLNKDEMHIIVDEGDNLMVPLAAKGIGTTMYSRQAVNVMDLGVQLTNVYFEKQIVLENKGRRPQQLKWHNKTVQQENAARLLRAKKLGKDTTGISKLPKNLAPIEACFKVTPEEIILRSRTATTFTFRGYSTTPQQISEIFVLESKVGKERYMKPIIESEVRVQIVNPLLSFSSPQLDFLYVWEKDKDIQIQKNKVILKNTSLLNLSFLLKTEVPFNLHTWDMMLAPDQEEELIVDFDPSYKDDCVSHVVEKSLQIIYRGHPQRDSINLRGEVVFPNLKFDASSINFGCVLNDTAKTIRVRATNTCKIDVAFEWIFLEQTAAKSKSRSAAVFTTPPSHVYDILPVKSVIKPGEFEDIEFTMFSTTNSKITGTVVCVVDGGPEYKFQIVGESSNVSYELDKSIMDFGRVLFTERGDQELGIKNTGKVTFNYTLTPTTPEDAKYLTFIPASGKVTAGQEVRPVIRIQPAKPHAFTACFTVQIAHFDPVIIQCYCQGIFSTASISLLRHRKLGPYGETDNVDNEMWEKFQTKVIQQYLNPDTTVLPPVLHPPIATASTIAPPVFVDPTLPPQPPVLDDASLSQTSTWQSSTKGIPVMLIDTEMQREVLCSLIDQKLSESIEKNGPLDASEPLLQTYISKNINISQITVARYICDFGNVIIGQTKKKLFKVTNASQVGQLSWLFDKKYLSATGFSIEPEKVNKLVEGGSVDFIVKFFARTQQKTGPKSITLPLQIPGSFNIQITLLANVCLPEVVLSTYQIDFQKVLLGESAKFYLSMHNPSPVAAEWSFKHTNGKDNARFIIEPNKGTLRPYKKTIVAFEFIPSEVKRCMAEYAVKVDQNRKPRSLKLIGEGFSTALAFDPEVPIISPVLPGSLGSETIITVKNLSDTAVEFFSLDFDQQYKDEESKLLSISDYDDRGYLRTKVRDPGGGLPKEVQTAFKRQQAAKSAAEQQAATVTEGAVTTEGATAEAPSDEVVVVAEPIELKSAPLRNKPGYRDENKHQDILVVGPPLSGVTTIANHLGKKLIQSVVTVDSLLDDVCECEGDVAVIARYLIDKELPVEAQERKQKEADMIAAAEQSKTTALETYTKEKKGKVKEIPPEIYQTAQVKALEEYYEQQKKSTDKIVTVLKFRTQWQDFHDGIIIDSIRSKYLAANVVMESLLAVFPGLIISSVTLPGDNNFDNFNEWIDHIYNSKLQEEEHLKTSMENSKRLLYRSVKPPKGKSLDEYTKDLDAVFARGIPEAYPNGDEQWLDSHTGQITELESNDFKALDDRLKVIYLRQLLFFFSTQLTDVQNALVRIKAYRPKVESTEDEPEQTATSTEGNEAATTTTEVKVTTQWSFQDYLDQIVPVLETVPRKSVNKVLVSSDQAENIEIGENEPEKTENTDTAVENKLAEGEEENKVSSEQEQDQTGGLYTIQLEGDETVESLNQLVISLIPAPKVTASDKENAVPSIERFQLYHKPQPRPNRKAIKNFQIVDLEDLALKPKPPVLVEVAPPVETNSKDKKPKSAKDKKAAEEAAAAAAAKAAALAAEQVYVPPPAPTRWTLPPQGSAQFKVRFQHEKEGKFESTMEFEMVGTGQRFSLPCNAVSAYPSINTDTRHLFTRRLKALAEGNPYPPKRYVIADNFFSFGSLALFKKPDWKKVISDSSSAEDKEKYQSIESTHSDIIRISNNGLYKNDVTITIEYAEGDVNNAFIAEPASVVVEEGETKEVRLWALPKEEREYAATIVITVKDNPTVSRFPIKCWGSEPAVNLEGPWSEALVKAEEALAKNTDKKQVKDLEAKLAALKDALLIDFDRVLLKKTETRTFTIANTSLVPVAWEINPGDFENSPNISFSPSAGTLGYNVTATITISFTSPEAAQFTGNFTLKHADAEGGLNTARATTKKFRIVSEAYAITAVSLSSEGQEISGSGSLDYGLLRVGDYAMQTLKMGNKGKYRIGYSFSFKKPSIQELVTLDPMEGTIEMGTALAEIKVTFCSKFEEIILKNNSDILVQIKEPLTGEIVETFPLLISAQTKFNRFRLQPSKGISFGAIRFDADPRVKRAELRNESNFEITYVVCPMVAEHDELDDLDPAAYGAFAYATPTALRIKEFGEDYMKRVSQSGGGGDAAGKGGKAKTPVSKGKGKDAAVAVPTNPSTLNPLLVDPDQLAVVPLPTDPLVIGAFTVFPRIATVLPGQSVPLQVKFDPSGCDTVKEKLRICVAGANPADALVLTLKAFELTGESCIPAIVTNDPHSIFEEQEIVSSLAESTGEKSTEGSGKIEKLPVGKVVYAEAEKMLAFGPVSCGQVGRGVVERIKISNPTKIDIKVKFKVVSPEIAAALAAQQAAASHPPQSAKDTKKDAKKDAKGKGKDKDAGAEVPVVPGMFVVQPESWEIPPHEHRFVNVYFNPVEMKSYRSVFIAEIDDEGVSTTTTALPPKALQQNGKQLTFDLGGSGTLPCISIDHPTDRNEEGKIALNYGTILVDRSSRKKITIRNVGVMPATCLFDYIGGSEFVFPSKGTSMLLQPGATESINVDFAPKIAIGNGVCTGTVKISVLNNTFDQYQIALHGTAYACDAMFETNDNKKGDDDVDIDPATTNADVINFNDINLNKSTSTSNTFILKSRANYPIKFEFLVDENTPKVVSLSPSVGHLAPQDNREITVTFATESPITLDQAKLKCILKKITYKLTSQDLKVKQQEEALWGRWDNAMKSIRPAYPEDLQAIANYDKAMKEYEAKVDAENKKGKKGKPVGPPPERCNIELAPNNTGDNNPMVYEVVAEPYNELNEEYATQQLQLTCNGVADKLDYECDVNKQILDFVPTYMFQTTGHRFNVINKSKIKLPINWNFIDIKLRRPQSSIRPISGTFRGNTAGTINTTGLNGNNAGSTTTCPFTIEPENAVVGPNGTTEFLVKFSPVEAEDYMYRLDGKVIAADVATNDMENTVSNTTPEISVALRGTSKRPVCHFEMVETRDYLSRRGLNLKNENGLASSIETPDLKIIELESTGLKTRNIYRFYVTNTTNESYEFLWESTGEPSPFWRCVQAAGMMFPGKRVEMIFEYLPEDVHVSEAFFKFSIPKKNLSQLFLFTGNVVEPKVLFNTSKIDFHSVMLGGEGMMETIYLENHENHLPFHFYFDKYSLMQLEGNNNVHVINISPKEGTVPPNGRSAITFHFKPQEEVIYNFNIVCHVKRKPNKLSINVKGEGYAVHPQIQLEQHQPTPTPTTANTAANTAHPPTTAGSRAPSTANNHSRPSSASAANHANTAKVVTEQLVYEKYINLKPWPAVNVADFGSVQVLDSLSKTISVLNAGKFNFDYSWNIESIGSMVALSGNKLNGTLLKGEQLEYKITFSPQREGSLENHSVKLTIAGKYVYHILLQGVAVKPAMRFSFLQHDFGPCFITSPGGSTVIEEQLLVVKNHDPVSNLSLECVFTKTRALVVECPPIVLKAGEEIQIPIKFSPREVKSYSFAVPFLVNGQGKVMVQISGQGCPARLELVNGSQRRTNFGVVNVNNVSKRTVVIVNKSIRPLALRLFESGGESMKSTSELNNTSNSMNNTSGNIPEGSGLQEKYVTYMPNNKTTITLQPKETLPIELSFTPLKRVSQFHEDLYVEYAGINRTLATLSGKAQGIEVHLDSDSIPFGSVVLDSQKIKKLTLENTGDMTITYQWQQQSFGPHFTITPLSGKVLPNNEAIFDVIFRPQFVDDDIRQDNISLLIPGLNNLSAGNNNISSNASVHSRSSAVLKGPGGIHHHLHKDNKDSQNNNLLSITCSGMCIAAPSGSDIQNIHFVSMARKATTKSINISNPTDKDWYLTPALQSPHWKVNHEIKVPAKGSAEIVITYYPLTMTQQSTNNTTTPTTSTSQVVLEAVHKGKLFIALPDGSAQLYELVGQANAPECSGVINLETPAKQATTTLLKVSNWLPESQKLEVSVNIVAKPCPATFVIAANATEVGANGTKEFPVRFVSYMEGSSKAIITFTNPLTGEFCFYELNVRTILSEVQEIFVLEAPVRQSARCIVTIENPLFNNNNNEERNTLVTMGSTSKPTEWWSCDNLREIRVKELLPISGNREGTFEVEYRPLVVTKSHQAVDHLMTIITQELGTFKYKLSVRATAPLLKQILRFNCPLGNVQTESFLFKAYHNSKADYQCSNKMQDIFSCANKTIACTEAVKNGWDGDELRVPINFEPMEIGEVMDVFKVTCGDIEYLCELHGVCTPPQPQGPFNISQCTAESGLVTTEITFRNCFNNSCQWSCTIDHPAFRITAPPSTAAAGGNNTVTFAVNAKTEAKLAIAFEPQTDHIQQAKNSNGGAWQNSSIPAKLFVSCQSKPNLPSWTYYLKGKVLSEQPSPVGAAAGKAGKKK